MRQNLRLHRRKLAHHITGWDHIGVIGDGNPSQIVIRAHLIAARKS
jgi:hypothetical protein